MNNFHLRAGKVEFRWKRWRNKKRQEVSSCLMVLFSGMVGYPPKGMHDPAIKDWIASHQVTADAWYVASPSLTVPEVRRLEKVGRAVEEFLDKVG